MFYRAACSFTKQRVFQIVSSQSCQVEKNMYTVLEFCSSFIQLCVKVKFFVLYLNEINMEKQLKVAFLKRFGLHTFNSKFLNVTIKFNCRGKYLHLCNQFIVKAINWDLYVNSQLQFSTGTRQLLVCGRLCKVV